MEIELVECPYQKRITLPSGEVITRTYVQRYTRRKKRTIPEAELRGVLMDVLTRRRKRGDVCAQYGVTLYYLDKELKRFREELLASSSELDQAGVREEPRASWSGLDRVGVREEPRAS